MNLATERQIAAARPDRSTWLAANAGSGKTRVLTNRVARLLLADVAPEQILCLTYTKSAAGEMQNRLFATLGAWAMMPEDRLRAALADLGETARAATADLSRARRLFARAIETPGGLKIQTIHSFCGALLRRFPLEAGVSPAFTEIDPRTVSVVIETVLEDIARGPDAGVLDRLAQFVGEERIGGLCQDILRRRAQFDPPLSPPEVWAEVGLRPGFSPDDLADEAFEPGDGALLQRLTAVLAEGSANDRKAAEMLAPHTPFAPSASLAAALEGPFLFGRTAKDPFGPKCGRFPTKDTRAALGPDAAALDALMDRIAGARTRRVALMTAERSAALHAFAAAFLPRVAALKQARGWLDFDDLILKTKALLSDPAVAQWVLYKLDGGLAHILVDEAQDTSPDQWEIVRLLAQELTSGASDRTIFVVGDQKQSIYSFQGADPAGFTRLQGHFREGLSSVGRELADGRLEHSFRSAPAILQAVDATFADGETGLGPPPSHAAFKDALPGRVDLWPPLLDAEDEEPTASGNAEGWDPVDQVEPEKATARLAQMVAAQVAQVLARGALGTAEAPRRAGPGDVLILFRKRGGPGSLFYQCLRALKARGVPVAGADRLILTEELAVRDLLALLSFLALPEDDLSLAATLRSPLLGWTEDDLFRVAHPRPPGSYLWHAVRALSPDADGYGMLDDLRNQTDFLRPHDLLDRVLTRHGGRTRLIARLGPECEEAIDALLAQALAYERVEVPSLTGFLEWMAAEDVEVKRQSEAAGARVRVMTIHGAKGLEAPIVLLPDCGAHRPPPDGGLLPRGDAPPLWKPGADEVPPCLMPDVAAAQAARAAEGDRLLYVAMTRAEQWLIVAAAGDLGKQATWHGQIAAGLERAGADALETPAGAGQRLTSGSWPPPPEVAEPDTAEPHARLPERLRAPAPPMARLSPTVAPTDLGGAKALPGEGADTDTALRYGTALHLLLEHLPRHGPAEWPAMTAPILATGPAVSEAEAADILEEATQVLSAPALNHLFAQDALAEVPLTAEVPGLDRPLAGTVDRLIVAPDHVLAVDFKSNRTVPATAEEVPEGILRQMGAYAAALAAIFPDRRIDTAILWTRTPTLMPLPHALVTAALARAAGAP